ncbi:Rad17 cell cycle checkpoint protein-domain-containing protein [Phascolomyces articulosus]|uniref:Rad17 cell cycle checkpoint protein-domain-containing protein n=1 Tax=Phascolomyces articulosus TaxID=60185 RepID=A0AAD5K8U0_9FUNG|nr:Rad17 cell cycle checkpoint protein-domain-containing protein [Phascolomyces articulosus]
MDPFYDQFVLPPYPTQRKERRTPSPRPAVTAARRMDIDSTCTDQLWVDKYAPTDENDLALRPAKLNEIKTCIQSSAIGRIPGQCKCLILNGPAGSGKSTTIRTIAKAYNYTLVEWKPTHQEAWDASQVEYQSTMKKFENFLQRATQLQPLYDPDTVDMNQYTGQQRQRRIILLDDIPDLTSDAVKSRFHELIEACINDTPPFLLVIIVSEAWMQNDSTKWKQYSETRLTNVRDVLSPSLVDNPKCTVIELNPITQKRIEKSLTMIQENEYRRTGHKLSKDQLTQIGELSRGDIRNAINMLQFYCIPPSRQPTQVPMKRKRELDFDNDDDIHRKNYNEKQVLAQAQERGAPLDLFHALGKVLFAKRDPRGQLESSPEKIMELLPVDSSLFLAYLHENMIRFFQDDLEACTKALDWISLADTMISKENWMETAPSQYQLLLAMRGIMQSRNKPVVTNKLTNHWKPNFRALSARKKEPSIGLWNRGLQIKNEIESEPSTWGDDIENFSDEEFDDVFGDGTDIAELDGW